MRINKALIICIIVLSGATFFIWQKNADGNTFSNLNDIEATIESAPTTYTKKVEIAEGSTFSVTMANASVSPATSQAIFTAAEEIYDLSKVRPDRALTLVYDIETDELQQLIYQIDTEEELFVSASTTASSTQWFAERIDIPYEVRIKKSTGTIESSMYVAALEADIDERAIIELAEVFQWSVDFALDVRKGDTFEFIYEERYRDGEYVMPGRILAGKYVNAGTPFYAFYFTESEENTGYFDENGNSVQKMFLKAPVAYKYISSGFTTGRRYVQAFNVSTGHRAIDYAASSGTPIRSVGDGTVTYAGWNGPYGNFVTIRHNGTYSTNYAHQSRIAVRVGQKVKQGDTIGYVGSTGFSTGPHLHYEMVKHGTKINPLAEALPPGQEIAEENKSRFFDEIQDYANQLGLNL